MKRNAEVKTDLELGKLNEITKRIIGIAIKVHKTLGSGFIEKIYEKAINYELSRNGLGYQNQKIIKVQYENLLLGNQRIDFLIENEIIVEIKSVSEINQIHSAQMLSYLKSIHKKIGLILNFAKPTLEIKRVIN